MADDTTPVTGDEPTPDEVKPDTPTPPTDDVAAIKAALRKANKEAETARLKVKEYEDAGKTETERLTGQLTAAEQRATAAEARAMRLEVAHAKGLTPGQAKRLVGATQEELEADADEILAEFSPKETRDDDSGRRPRERLRSGAAPDEEEDPDIDAAVARTRRF